MAIIITSFILTAVITAVCIWFYDKLLAIYISRLSFNNLRWHKLTADIPDTLLLTVCIITIFACAGYLTRKNRGIYDNNTKFFHLIMYVMPVSYVVKSLLKYVFGRITTREWLIRPDLYGFHWFNGGGSFDGFPSGHMVVFTALTASLWRFYPRHRAFYSIFLLTLGIALIATNYHFLSDVIAGAYLGVIVEACMYKALNAGRPPAVSR